MHLWRENLDDTKHANWITTRQRLSSWTQTEPFTLTLSPLLFVLTLPTFPSRPVMATLVSWLQITWLDKHISAVCRSAHVEFRRISSIRQYLTVEATKTLDCAFVLSKLGYCNSLLFGYPLYLLCRVPKVQNSAAKLVFKARKRDYVQPLLQALHWLPVQARIDCKLSTICHDFFSDLSPAYFSDRLNLCCDQIVYRDKIFLSWPDKYL